mmetsp:Transcript_16262/g.18091  ORF Transcript_16262/g.18091 Transcript_16262/m.18091 type:complete len:162 (+) Transcript_16262:125-610(+)
MSKVSSVELRHSNPSLGPHNKPVSITLSNTKEHQKEFSSLMSKTTLNGVCSLEKYAAEKMSGNEKIVEKVNKAVSKGSLNCGQTISTFTIFFEDETSIKVHDLRVMKLEGYYSEFVKYLVKNGKRREESFGLGGPPTLKKKPVKKKKSTRKKTTKEKRTKK